MSATTREEYNERYEAKLDHIEEHGFHRMLVSIGGDGFMGAFGGITEAAVCRTCWAFVPVVDLSNASTAVAEHASWHEAGGEG